MQKANMQIMEAHKRKMEKTKGKSDYYFLEERDNQLRKTNRDDFNGNNKNSKGPVFPNEGNGQQFEQPPSAPPQQMMGKTKMMNEIQEQIKQNFDEELAKLRNEMSSRQKELRNQMENLKSEAEKALRERNEAHEELNRMKEMLDKKRDQEGYQK
jgi:outer membrane murein-binding lipoprotein Lpp